MRTITRVGEDSPPVPATLYANISANQYSCNPPLPQRQLRSGRHACAGEDCNTKCGQEHTLLLESQKIVTEPSMILVVQWNTMRAAAKKQYDTKSYQASPPRSSCPSRTCGWHSHRQYCQGGGGDADETGLGFPWDLFAIFVLGTIWWYVCCRREAEKTFQVSWRFSVGG